MLAFLTFIGILFFPVFTLGCVLIHYDDPILGIIKFCKMTKKVEKKAKKSVKMVDIGDLMLYICLYQN